MSDLNSEPKTNHKVTISVGSNIDHEKNITAALDALYQHYGKIGTSAVYQSPAKTSQKSEQARFYYNLVVCFYTEESLQNCKKSLYAIEHQLDRKRNHPDVTCDLDLLTYDEMCGTFGGITLPHRDILECDYVLRPLADLQAEILHPQIQQSYEALWQAFDQPSVLEPVEFKWKGQLLSLKPLCLSL